jgi:hypothetical protein
LWENSSNAAAGLTRKGLNSLVILGAWTLWNHRNICVFDGATPNLVGAMGFGGESAVDFGWSAGAISFLGTSPPLP